MEVERLSAEVVNCAAKLKTIFADYKAEKSGKAYRPQKRMNTEDIWLAAAEKCISLGSDPHSFIRSAFLFCSILGGPYPQNLSTRAVDRWYKEYQQTYGDGSRNPTFVFKEEVMQLFRHATRTGMNSAIHKKFSDFLLDDAFTDMATMPAFVRVLSLPHDERLFKKFGRRAYQDLMGNQRLLDVIRELNFPLHFIERIKNKK